MFLEMNLSGGFVLFVLHFCISICLQQKHYYTQTESSNIDFGLTFYVEYQVASVLDCAMLCPTDIQCFTADVVKLQSSCLLVYDTNRIVKFAHGFVVIKEAFPGRK